MEMPALLIGGICLNPLTEVVDVTLGGDVPDFNSWGYVYDENNEKLQYTADQLMRGMTVFTTLKENNPCSDFYYIINDVTGEPEQVGTLGDAKYKIETVVSIDKDVAGEKGLVMEQYILRTPDPNNPGRYIILDESVTTKLVDLQGKIHVDHNLIAMKNDMVYDNGYEVWDWVPEPPEEVETPEGLAGSMYFGAFGEKLEDNGQLYLPEDGIVVGNFSTLSLSGTEITFDKGDIGITIRKKETPQSCIMDVDDSKEHAPYYHLTFHTIKNLFGEPLPDNVRIALKPKNGTIEDGEEVDGWQVVNTTGATTDEVSYLPPECSKAKVDELQIAGMCEFNDGPPAVGETFATKSIDNTKCNKAWLWVRCGPGRRTIAMRIPSPVRRGTPIRRHVNLMKPVKR